MSILIGLDFSQTGPDTNTIWRFKENDNEGKLFDLFYKQIEAHHLIVSEGKLVDASFHEDPRQCKTREENKMLKAGSISEQWKKKQAQTTSQRHGCMVDKK